MIPRPPRREVDRRALRPDEARALVAIAAYRARYGTGPSWRAVGRAVGWHGRTELQDRLFALRRAGLVRFSRQPGSLDVTAGAASLALGRLRELGALERRPAS